MFRETSLLQTLGLPPLDLSGLTAPSIGYKTEGQRQATNEKTTSIGVLASVSLVTNTADLVIGVRKYYFNSKQLGKGFIYQKANIFLPTRFFPV